MTTAEIDREMEAVKTVYEALVPLDHAARLRILAIVCCYFDLISVETKSEILMESFATSTT